MKELTIEQKAKAYDEALEKAKQIILEYDYDEHDNVFMEIFPELRESEDERIWKALITFFQRFPYDSIEHAGTNAKDALAWLEKQGNSPIKWNKNTEGNKPQVNHSVPMKTTQGIAGGFQWKYGESTESISPIRHSMRKICVAKYDEQGNFITAYSSCREAARENNLTFQVISECINGKRKTSYGGFVWKKLIENS